MSGRKNRLVSLGFVLSVSMIASALTALLVSHIYSRLQFDSLNFVCGEILEQDPEAGQMISAALKAYEGENTKVGSRKDVLSALGYHVSDFTSLSLRQSSLFAAAGGLTGVLLFILTFFYRNKKETRRIQALAEYLEQVNTGKAVILTPSGEDDFSKLEDEIYKTVTFLYQTKDTAVQAKNDFAENLSNIAHQFRSWVRWQFALIWTGRWRRL